jgi:hypothetical protein
MNTKAESTTDFKFLDAKLYVRHIRAHPSIPLAHNDILKTNLAYYDMTSIALKVFTFFSVSSSLSIDQAVTGHLHKRLLFAMADNNDFLGTVNSKLFRFQAFGIHTYVMYLNGRQVPNETLTFDMSHENTSVMVYKTLF